jgi:hypothetical protein
MDRGSVSYPDSAPCPPSLLKLANDYCLSPLKHSPTCFSTATTYALYPYCPISMSLRSLYCPTCSAPLVSLHGISGRHDLLGDQYGFALDHSCHSSDPLVTRIGNLFHARRVRTHFVGPCHHRHFNPGHSGAQTDLVQIGGQVAALIRTACATVSPPKLTASDSIHFESSELLKEHQLDFRRFEPTHKRRSSTHERC